jgi:hypothetical protein
MVALDCESFESALHSSAAILGISPSQLLAALREYYTSLSEAERNNGLCIDSLVDHCFGVCAHDLPAPPLTNWFHATRVAPGTAFGEGILPLSAMLDPIWTFLGQLAGDWSTKEEWLTFRNNMKGRGAYQYHKRLTRSDEGPYAFLVRPTIFVLDQLGHWDYLGIPEIVDDICESHQEIFDRDLRRRFLDATRPCIVKFWSADTSPDEVATALAFIFTVVAGDEISTNCVLDYNRQGRRVEPGAIVSVQWPERVGNSLPNVS